MIANPLLDFISLFRKPEYEKVKPIEMSLDVNGKLEGGGKNGFTIAPTVMQQPPQVKENTFDRVLGFLDRRGIPDVGSLLSHGVGDLLDGGTMGNAPDFNNMGGMMGQGFQPASMSAASREAQSNHVVPQMPSGAPGAIPFMEKQFSAAQAMQNQDAAEGSAGGATKVKTPATDAGTPAAPATKSLPGQEVVASAPTGPSPVVTDVGVGGQDMAAQNADFARAMAIPMPPVQAPGATLQPVPAQADTSATVAAPEAAMAQSNALGAYPDVSGGYVDPMSLLPLVKNSGLSDAEMMLEAQKAKAARGAYQRSINMMGMIPKAAGLFAGPHVPGSGILRGAINGANLGLEFTDRRSDNRYQEALEGLALRASQGDVEAAKEYQAFLNEMGVGTSNKAEQFKAMQEVLRGGGGVPEVSGEGVPAGAAGGGGEVVPAGLPGTSGASGLAKKVATRAQTEERAKLFRALEPYFHDEAFKDILGTDKSAVGRMSRDQMMDLTSKIGQREAHLKNQAELDKAADLQRQKKNIDVEYADAEAIRKLAALGYVVRPEWVTKELADRIIIQHEAGMKKIEERQALEEEARAYGIDPTGKTDSEIKKLLDVEKDKNAGKGAAAKKVAEANATVEEQFGVPTEGLPNAFRTAITNQAKQAEELGVNPLETANTVQEVADAAAHDWSTLQEPDPAFVGPPAPYENRFGPKYVEAQRNLEQLAEQKARKDAIQKGELASYTSESGKKTATDMRVENALALVRTLFNTPNYPFDKIDPYSIMNYEKAGGASLETSQMSSADLALYENNVRPLVEGYKVLQRSEMFDPVSRRYRGKNKLTAEDFVRFAKYGEYDREGRPLIFTDEQLMSMARMVLEPGEAVGVIEKLKKMERPVMPMKKGNEDPFDEMYKKFPQNFWADLISKGIGTGARTQKEQEPYRNVGEWIGPTTIRKPKPEDFNWVLPVSK